MNQILFFVLIAILLFAIYGSFNLSMVDYKKKNVCPKVFGIPACYLVFVFFVLALVAHVFNGVFADNLWYYAFIAVPFLLALTGTLTELSGKEICPRTPGGTPMCYISLGLCSTLLLIKFGEVTVL